MVEKRGEDSNSNSLANKLILKSAVNKKVDHILKKGFISEKEVYDLVRGFFKKFLNIEYEFTREELTKELKKIYLPADIQRRVTSLLDRLSEIEHVSRSFSREELETVLDDFKRLVNELITSHYEKTTFMRKVKDSIHNSFSGKHKEILEQDSRALSEDERTIVKMNMLLDNARRWSDYNPERAKAAYAELLAIYNGLDNEKKAAYYKPVSELYMMIKNKG